MFKKVPSLESAAADAARKLWDQCKDQQLIVWLDNWYRKRFGTDPRQSDMSLNVSVVAILHIPEIPIFMGHKSLGQMISGISSLTLQLSRVPSRLLSGVACVIADDLQPDWIRVPLDVHRTGMRSLQWLPFLLTEYSVGCQADLLHILHDLRILQGHTKRAVPLLVDMDIHYRMMKLMYGVATSEYSVIQKFNLVPFCFGVW